MTRNIHREDIVISRLKYLFAIFSFIVLAAPAHAQDREHGNGRLPGSVQRTRGEDRGDNRAERDDEENDDNRVSNRNGNERDDNENDDENDDNGDRRGIGRNGCIDSNGNNVCDIVNRSIPSTLPEMINAVLVSRGQLTSTGRSWLGGSSYTPRFTSAGNRAPSQIVWLDRNHAVRQVWLDTNRDGRADVVKFYRKGKLVRTIRR